MEQSLETCLQQKSELRCQLDVSSLDIELATLQCKEAMHILQLAAQSSSETISQQGQLNAIHQHMERLTTERKSIAVNHHASALMERHHRVLSKLLSTVASMTNVMSSTREKLERAIELRNNRIDEHEHTIADLRNHIEGTQTDIAMMADARTQALIEKSVLTETMGQLRNQLSLVEAQASEVLNVSLTQNERERQVVVRLEATVANLREELNNNVLEMERWTMQQRLDVQQRSDLSTTMEELENEKTAWKQAATTFEKENEELSTMLSKTKYELEYQGQTLSQQVNDFKSNDLRQRGRIEELHEEIRGLKDDLKSALEKIEREKHNTSAHGSTNSELMELRERITYVRGKQEIAESKVKAQRDEMEDLARAHRSQTTDQDDMIRRLKVQLVDAQTQEARLLPMQKKIDDFTHQLFALTQESKSLAMEVGNLKAENAMHVLRQLQREEADTIIAASASTDNKVKMKEEVISELQVDNERLRSELTRALRERDMANANLQCMEGRKDFLTKTLEEVQEQVTKLSGQVQRERSLGSSTEQRIFEIRALVPHWRWEEKLRTDRTLALPGSPTNSNTSFRSLNSSNILPR